ncbi:MAG: hypothetical protein ACKKMO_01425 [Candidatus Nealsonbacteria bacterium]
MKACYSVNTKKGVRRILQIIKIKYPYSFLRVYYSDETLSDYKNSQSIRWLDNKKIGFKRLGKVGALLAKSLRAIKELSDAWISQYWFIVIIKKGTTWDELEPKILQFFDRF